MRGQLYSCTFHNGSNLHLQLDFDCPLPGFVWAAWAYEYYQSNHGDDYYFQPRSRRPDWFEDFADAVGDGWKMLHCSVFAMIAQDKPHADLTYVHGDA